MLPLAAIDLSPLGMAAAFAAGVLAFASPCVWPLVPAYLSYVSGVAYDDLGENARRVGLATAAFVAGFTLVFIGFGATAGLFGSVLLDHRRTLEVAGGALVIVMGLALLGLAGGVLAGEHRLRLRSRPASLAGAGLAGVAFGVGWSPCIGPTLAAILALASTHGSAGEGAALLAVYGLGLGVPFLLAGLGASSLMARAGVLRRHQRTVTRVAGAGMVAMGALLLTGQLTAITRALATTWVVG